MTRKTPNRKSRFRTLQPRPQIRKLPKRRLKRKSRRPKLMFKLRSKKAKEDVAKASTNTTVDASVKKKISEAEPAPKPLKKVEVKPEPEKKEHKKVE